MGTRFAAECGGQTFRRGDDYPLTSARQERQTGNDLRQHAARREMSFLHVAGHRGGIHRIQRLLLRFAKVNTHFLNAGGITRMSA